MIVVTDLEGTLTAGATWRGMGEYLKLHRSALAYYLFLLSMLPRVPLVQAGILDRQTTQNEWLMGLLRQFKGATPDEVTHLAGWVVEREMWPKRREAVLAEIEQHRQAGARVLVASGTFQPIVETFARRIGVEALGTPIEFEDGKTTGCTTIKMNVFNMKARRVQEFLGGAAVDVAYGDTISDAPLLELARSGVAVCPDAKLRKIAEERGWRIMGSELRRST